MNMRSIAFTLLLVAMSICTGTSSWAQCSPLDGGFGYAYSGLLHIGKGPSMSNFQPTATSGQIDFTPTGQTTGTLEGEQIDNSGGVVFTRKVQGTYKIDDATDCTGTMERQFLNSNGIVVFVAEESFTVVNGGNEIKFIRTSPPSFMVQGSMTKQ